MILTNLQRLEAESIDIMPEAVAENGTTALRLLTCGSPGDGKTTLAALLCDDAPADKRKFTVDDMPGDEQDMRNMVAAASTADLALILVDARNGVLTQTRRHSYLLSIIGIRYAVLAVNKLDLVDYSKDVFDRIKDEYRAFAEKIGLRSVVCIPISALKGDNITMPSANTPWYPGPTLMGYLETVVADDDTHTRPFRMPVQWVNGVDDGFGGFSGRIVGGSVRPGDRVRVLPSGNNGTVARIVTADGDLSVAVAGQSVTVTLEDDIDVSRGDLLCAASAPAGVADQFEAAIIWMSEEPMYPSRPYLLKSGSKTVGVTLAKPKHRVNVNTLEHLAAKTLELNEIGVCNLNLDQPIPFDPYEDNHDTGAFIIIDRQSNNTAGAGLLHFALRRSQNIHWQSIEINKQAHASLKGQKPAVVWFTGLSGAGKSTIANVLERKLHAMGRHTYLLDGDNVRHGLNKDLGFTEADRVENIRRVAEVAKLMVDAGLIVLVSFISPFRAERRLARELVQQGEFCEVFVDTPLQVAEERDPKGLYQKARRGDLKNFTGIDSPYEPPEHAELRIDTTRTSAEDAAESVIRHLREMGILQLEWSGNWGQ